VSEENQFEQYWRNYGELHASMCGGDIKQFAKDIWLSASSFNEKRKAEIVAQMWGEYFCENGSVTPQEPTAKFLHWIEQKAKGER